MPRNIDLKLTNEQFTEITDADVTRITIQNKSISDVHITATAGTGEANRPDHDDNGLGTVTIKPTNGLTNALLSDYFPGVTGANRIWAISNSDDAEVFVSHA